MDSAPRVMYRRSSIRNNFPSRRNVSMDNLELKMFFLVFVLMLWFFAWMLQVKSVYRPQELWLGPNSAMLIEPNVYFVQSVKVTELAKSKSGLELYGFHRSPPLAVMVNWSESHLLSISQNSNKGWSYYLNQGTSLNILYSIKTKGSSVQLVVNEGIRGISQFMYANGYRDTFSWNLIEGSGVIELKISKSSSYSFSVNNLNMKDIEVELDIDVRAVVYDTKEPFYKCTLSSGGCTFDGMPLVGYSLVLTSPPPSEGVSTEEEWCVLLSYESRMFTCVVGTVVVIFFALVAMKICELKWGGGEREMSSQRTHLLEDKDEDSSSVGSSNESLAADDADLEDFVGQEGDTSKSSRRLCVICFDSPRDCFFLHCGHCVSCFQCGTKVVETSGSCPICRRKIKKVKRIYTV